MDIVGKRGEVLFGAIITRWCGGQQWFDQRFLGEKAEALDFEVTPVGMTKSVFEECTCLQQIRWWVTAQNSSPGLP